MDEAQQVSNLIGHIYDTALDPELWPEALEQACDFVPGWSAGLFYQDNRIQSGNAYFTWNIPENYIQSYFDQYLLLSPFTPTALFFEIGSTHSNIDIIPHDEFRRTRFFREWAQPQGLLDTLFCNLEKSATAHVMFSIMRHERNGVVNESALKRFALLAPHVRRAATIGKVIDLHKVEAAALADTLDGLAAAMILVDANGRIVHANVSGHTLLADCTALRGTGGKLSSADPRINQSLHDVFTAAGRGDLEIGIKGIAISLSERDGERWLAHILPLTSGARRKAGTEYSAVAAVFVRKAALDLPHPLEALAHAYKLTPTEMRVLVAIVQIGGVPEIAPVLGIAETTVKTHLARLFAKTGTNRQADLVKIAASYMSPLGG